MPVTINKNKYGIPYSVTPFGITISGETRTYDTYEDMLSDPVPPKIAVVLDATADATVETGSAVYVNRNGVWIKWYETEAMDAVVKWNAILGRPEVSVNDIELAIEDMHKHNNKNLLDSLRSIVENGTPTGYYFGNVEILTQNSNLDWNKLRNGPSASAADIDTVVRNAHSHTNLDYLSKVGYTDGYFTFNGTPVGYLPEDNIILSPSSTVTGYNNLVGGYPAKVTRASYNAVSEEWTIRLQPLANKDDEFKSERYIVGERLYLHTKWSDDLTMHNCLITNVVPIVSGTGDTAYTTAVDITIRLNEEDYIDTTWNPTRCYMKFTNRSLDVNGTMEKCKYTSTADSLGIPAGTPVRVINTNDNTDALATGRCTWSGVNLTCLFTAEQPQDVEVEYAIVTNAGGVDVEPSFAIVKDENFEYTTLTDGEYNANAGANSVVTGKWSYNVGDFVDQHGLGNINLSNMSDIGGVTNIVGEGTNITMRGVDNRTFGEVRDVYCFGGKQEFYADGTFGVGDMNKLKGMNTKGLGFNLQLNAYGSFGVGDMINTNYSAKNSTNIGRNLTNSAPESVLMGQNGILPLYEGTLAKDSQNYNVGSTAGIHYKGALAFATGEGRGAASNKNELGMIFSKYRWIKNPAFPWGSTGTAATRNSSIEHRMTLIYDPLCQIMGRVSMDSIEFGAKMVKSSQSTNQVLDFKSKFINTVFVDNGAITNIVIDHSGTNSDIQYGILVIINGGNNVTFGQTYDNSLVDVSTGWMFYNQVGTKVASPSLSSLGAEVFLVGSGVQNGALITVARQLLSVTGADAGGDIFSNFINSLF